MAKVFTRDDVIAEFPELDGDPNDLVPGIDNGTGVTQTKHYYIQSWIRLWTAQGHDDISMLDEDHPIYRRHLH